MTRVVIALKEMDFVHKFRFSPPNRLTVTFDSTRTEAANIAELIAYAGGFAEVLPEPP